MPVVSGHDAADDLPIGLGHKQQPVTGRQLLVDHKLRCVVQARIAEDLLPQRNQLLAVGRHVELVNDFLHPANTTERRGQWGGAPFAAPPGSVFTGQYLASRVRDRTPFLYTDTRQKDSVSE